MGTSSIFLTQQCCRSSRSTSIRSLLSQHAVSRSMLRNCGHAESNASCYDSAARTISARQVWSVLWAAVLARWAYWQKDSLAERSVSLFIQRLMCVLVIKGNSKDIRVVAIRKDCWEPKERKASQIKTSLNPA